MLVMTTRREKDGDFDFHVRLTSCRQDNLFWVSVMSAVEGARSLWILIHLHIINPIMHTPHTLLIKGPSETGAIETRQ